MTYWQALGGVTLFATGCVLLVGVFWSIEYAWLEGGWRERVIQVPLVLIVVSTYIYFVDLILERAS